MAGERGRGRPRTIDRVEAVQTAMQLWWAEGVDGVSLNAISRRTGLSKSSLYREFGGEDGLMVAALEQYRTLAMVPLLKLFENPLAPQEVLALVVRAATSAQELPPGCFFTKLRLSSTSLGEATRSLVAQMVEERLSTFEVWYGTVIEQGRGASLVSAPRAARYIDAQLTLILVRLAAGDSVEWIRADATLALSVLLT